jgi:hypothetical protein
MGPTPLDEKMDFEELFATISRNLEKVIYRMNNHKFISCEMKVMEDRLKTEMFYKKNLRNPILAPKCYERLGKINYLYVIFYLDKYIRHTKDIEYVYRISPFRTLFNDENFSKFLSEMQGFFANLFLEQLINLNILHEFKDTGLSIIPKPDIHLISPNEETHSRLKYLYVSLNDNFIPIKLIVDELFYKDISDQLEYFDSDPEILIKNFDSELSNLAQDLNKEA